MSNSNNKNTYDYLKSLLPTTPDNIFSGILGNLLMMGGGTPGGAPGERTTKEINGPIQSGPVKIYNGGTLRKSVDEFSPHHSYNSLISFNLSNNKKRKVSYRKTGYLLNWKGILDNADYKKMETNSKNGNLVVYDLVIKQNNISQPVGIYAPFDCKVIFTRGNPNSAIGLIGIGPGNKGKTAAFLHIVPSTQNKNANKQFPDSVLEQLKKETFNKTFKKGELIAYQGNWGAQSTDTHLHIEAMTKEDFDKYITELPSFYS
jgi:hypothetical protein